MTSDGPSDARLMRDLQRGDRAALEQLYRRHGDWVHGLARRFSRDDAEAHDLLQEAFLHLWTRPAGFELTSRLRTYLYPVVRNLARGRRRDRLRAVGDGLPELEADELLPQGEEHADLARALGTLPPGQREVLLLRFVDGLELAEIATALEIPLGTVKSRLHQALERLRREPGTRDLLGG